MNDQTCKGHDLASKYFQQHDKNSDTVPPIFFIGEYDYPEVPIPPQLLTGHPSTTQTRCGEQRSAYERHYYMSMCVDCGPWSCVFVLVDPAAPIPRLVQWLMVLDYLFSD
jgi:hypothetical protein